MARSGSKRRSPALATAVARRVRKLGDARARFCEVVRLALSEGPQRITRRGQPAVLIIADSGDGDQASGPVAAANWVDELRGTLPDDIDLMALIGPRDKRDRGSRSDPIAKLLRDLSKR